MIEIQDIIDKNERDIIDLLLDEKEQPFEIYVPKSTVLFGSTSSDIADDYAMLAFAGQKLSEVAEEFDYNYVSPSDHESVLFEVTTKDIQSLAKAILYISYGYNNESDGDEVFYLDEVYDFIEKVNSGEVNPICEDFIEDFNEYYKEIEEDD